MYFQEDGSVRKMKEQTNITSQGKTSQDMILVHLQPHLLHLMFVVLTNIIPSLQLDIEQVNSQRKGLPEYSLKWMNHTSRIS
jgi:hypothetical protein